MIDSVIWPIRLPGLLGYLANSVTWAILIYGRFCSLVDSIQWPIELLVDPPVKLFGRFKCMFASGISPIVYSANSNTRTILLYGQFGYWNVSVIWQIRLFGQIGYSYDLFTYLADSVT